MTRPSFFGWFVSGIFLLAGNLSVLMADPVPAGFGFPVSEETLRRIRDEEQVAKLREHAWTLWAAINQPAKIDGGPLWETWYDRTQTLTREPSPPAPLPFRAALRFEKSRQHAALETGNQNLARTLLSAVLFNEAAYRHVRENKYYDTATYKALNAEFDRNQTPTEERTIKPFPRESMVLLTAWWHVKQKGLTALPVWDFEPTRPLDWGKGAEDPTKRLLGNYSYTWKRFVAIDPTRKDESPETTPADVDFTYFDMAEKKTKTERKTGCRVVGLSSLFHVRIETDEAVAAAQEALGEPVEKGDFAALVALHMSTREVPRWWWATFWWHDKPLGGRNAQNRPDEVPGVFRNYLMNTVIDPVTPREYDGSQVTAFNPYIESHFANGLGANCIACHQRVAYPMQAPAKDIPIYLPVTRGGMRADDPFFKGKVRLDYLWPLYLDPYQN
jgi:hypothetical protein